MYVADFETSTTEPTYVWGYAITEIGNVNNITYGSSMRQFFDTLIDKEIYYFHNLKFDGMFILDFILHEGIKFTKSRAIGYNEFTSVISDVKQFYLIKINYFGKVVEFRDSMKKLNFSVDRIAKSFLREDGIEKGEIDYSKRREEGDELTQEDMEYIKKDVVIVARALEIQFNYGMTQLTNGADALLKFKKMVGKKFRSIFPVLDIDVDKKIRQSYKGGYTHIKSGYVGVDIEEHGEVYDVNSLYPFVMCSPFLYPIGDPLYFDGQYQHDDVYPLYVQCFSCMFELKPGHLPTIQIKKSSIYKDSEYITSSDGVVTLVLTKPDFELFLEHYDIIKFDDNKPIIYNWGYKFKAASGIFDEYIKPIYDLKCNSKGAQKELYKLLLNSLYGKLSKRIESDISEPYLDEALNIVKFRIIKQSSETIYIPAGTYVTSYAREYTIRMAQRLYNQFVYADTDSLHIIGKAPEWLDVHPTRLGALKHEYSWTKARFIRPKRYIEVTNEESVIKCCGLSSRSHPQITWENFNKGTCYVGNLKQHVVPGGVILKDSGFILD